MHIDDLFKFWTGQVLIANIYIGLNIVGGLFLGLLIGYERTYNGRAAGMRTYGLVCMASTALVVFVGWTPEWYGTLTPQGSADATRVVQGIVTGIGFLGAGVIMKEGLSISGLTTAASIWAASAVGILLGVGFYPAAILMAVLCAGSLSILNRIEGRLPGRCALEVEVKFTTGIEPDLATFAKGAASRGYEIQKHTLIVHFSDNQLVWRVNVVAVDRSHATTPAQLGHALQHFHGMSSFSITPIRN